MDAAWHTSGSVQWEMLMHELGINKLPHHIIDTDIIGKHLDSVLRWQDFYAAYSRWMGFSIRKNNVRKDDDGSEWQRLWVCSREGFRREKWINLPNRKKAEKCNTRNGCKAKFAVTRVRTDNTWKVTAFEVQHNHELASLSEIQFLRSHRRPTDGASMDPTKQSQSVVDTCDILDCVALEPGARTRLAFLRKDVFTKLEARRNDLGHETDAEGALGYLTCLAIRDRNFFCKFTVDAENHLDNVFWSDGISRKDYATFGDVVAIDASFKSNAFNRPVLIIVGVNHHCKTTVFGVAVLSDETTETYEWVFEQFLACMDKRAPRVVVTDRGPAVRAALSTVMPTAVHRLCTWHLDLTAGYNVSSKEFKVKFLELIHEYYSESEFEEKWNAVVVANKLEQSEWAKSVYDKRRSWAETFLRGNFFGGMRTTKRCDPMEPYLKRFAENDHLMRDFICQIDTGVAAIRFVQTQDDYDSKHGEPDIPQDDALSTYYSQFAKSYTKTVYESIAKEIKAHHSYSVTATEYAVPSRVFRLNQFPIGEVRHQVKYDSNYNNLSCTCLLFETDGIPCRHIFTVMKFLNMSEIPPCLFTHRWRKSARDHNSSPNENAVIVPQEVVESTRFASLASEFNALGFYASKREDTYDEAKRELAKLTVRFREVVETRRTTTPTDGDNNSSACEEEVAASVNVAVHDSDNSRTTGTGKDDTPSKGKERESEELTPAKKKHCSQPSPNSASEASTPMIRHFAQLSPCYSTQPLTHLPNSSSEFSSPMIRHFAQLSPHYSTQPQSSSSNTVAHLQINSSTDITSD